MYLKLLVALCLLALVIRLVQVFRPSPFGLAFGLWLLYIPVMERFPLNLATGVNLVTISMVVIWCLRHSDGLPPAGRRSTVFRNLLLAWLGVSMFGFMLALGGSIPFSELVVLFKRWLDPILFGLLALWLARKEDQKFAVACVIVGFLLVSLKGVRDGLDFGHKSRVTGLIGQPNDLGAFLAIYTPLVLAVGLFLAKGLLRYAHFGLVYLGGWALIFTQSRASFIGFAVSILGLLFFSGRKGLSVLGVMLVLLIWMVPEILPEKVTTRFELTFLEEAQGNEALEEQLETSAASRIRIWKESLDLIADHPLGVGFAQFKHFIGYYGTHGGRDSHNFYILTWAELGIVGLLIFLALLWRILADSRYVWTYTTDQFARTLGLGIFSCVLVSFIINFFGSKFMDVQVSTYLWVLAAAIAGMRDTLSKDMSEGQTIARG